MNIICPEHKGPIEISSKKIIEASQSLKQMIIVSCPVCHEQIVIHNVWIGDQPPAFPMDRSLVYKEHKWIYTDHSVA